MNTGGAPRKLLAVAQTVHRDAHYKSRASALGIPTPVLHRALRAGGRTTRGGASGRMAASVRTRGERRRAGRRQGPALLTGGRREVVDDPQTGRRAPSM